MENLFVESEELVYIDIVGDPIFDVYDDDDCVQYKYTEFDVRWVEIKNGVVIDLRVTKVSESSTSKVLDSRIQRNILQHVFQRKKKLKRGWKM